MQFRVLALASVLAAIGIPPVQAACPSSETLVTGGGPGPWYQTLAPSEHFDSARSQRFPSACGLRPSAAGEPPKLLKRVAPAEYPEAYNIATREPHELFVYGGYPGVDGAYVAKLDADSLVEQWRSTVRIPAGQWSFIGAMGVLADGFVYSIQSNQLQKVDGDSGVAQVLALPQIDAPAGTGAAYNGFVASPDGLIFAKSMERGACDRDTSGGLDCVIANRLPSTVVVVDPQSMTVLAQAQTGEPALGRITTERHDGADYIYVPGLSALLRYRYADGVLSLDSSWGPVPYGSTGANASGVGVLGDYVVVQTNYVPSTTPSWLVAANIHDSAKQFAMQPFTVPGGGYLPISWVPDKAALDDETGIVYAEDMFAGQIAAVRVGDQGLELLWKLGDIAKGFPALVGPRESRQLVVPQLLSGGDTLAWREARSGALIAQSPALAGIATIGASAPGFRERFYYPSFSSNELIELRPAP